MTFAIIVLRSRINAKPKAKKTMDLLNLTRINHCVVVPENEYSAGMLKQVKDYVTWGEVDPATLELLMVRRGGDITDALVKENTKFDSIAAFCSAVISGKAALKEIPDIEKVFRLHPPRKGHGGIKRAFVEGGALGYRGKEINELIARMMPEV